jgi:hypothetical protein
MDTRFLTSGRKAAGVEANHSPPDSAEVLLLNSTPHTSSWRGTERQLYRLYSDQYSLRVGGIEFYKITRN